MANTVNNYLQINKKTLYFFSLLVPFFEPMTFEHFESHGINVNLWETVGHIYLISRVVIGLLSCLYFLFLLSLKKYCFSKSGFLLILNVSLWGIASIFSHGGDLKLWGNIVQIIGFTVLCSILIYKSEYSFYRSLIILFKTLTIFGIISIVLHPYGYLNAKTTNEAFYFLGGKNGSFPYYYFFFYSSIIYCLIYKKKKPRLYLWILLTFIAAIICHSANSIFCLLLVLICLLLIEHSKKIVNYINPNIIVILLVIFLIMIYSGNIVDIVKDFLKLIGRGTTFSGRDILWKQAFTYITRSPLWGVGNNAVFMLRGNKNAVHAHSLYLNRLALHGIVPFIFFILSIFHVLQIKTAKRHKHIAYIIRLVFIIYLVHMSFDTYAYYFPILLILMCEHGINKIRNEKLLIL